MIEAKNLGLTYPGGKGIFNVSFSVKEGQVMGYLGPNGAGKTTTIRMLMGFMQAEKGSCTIDGKDCFVKAPEIQKKLGYIPGEIAFVEGMKGDEYLHFLAEMRGTKDTIRRKELIERFEFNPKGSVKKFSKGMKQKLGMVAAFMHDPEVLILDEPTSGLDPLMQNRFVELILEEKARGKTILMSSHMFEEVERTCDHVLMIKDGKIVTESDVHTLKSSRRKIFLVRPENPALAVERFQKEGFALTTLPDGQLEIAVVGDGVKRFVQALGSLNIVGLDTKPQTLEDVFMHFYVKEGQ